MTNHSDSFSDLMSEENFEVVMRGYSRRQVHDYINRLRNQIRDLEERLARTLEQAEQSRIELAEARRRLAEAPQDYDELGQRLSTILKLGEEEAAAKRKAAEEEANKVRERASAEAQRLITTTQEQAQAMVSAAHAEAERRVAEATATAERMLAQAEAEAEEKLATAQAEAEATRSEARAEAERMLADAQARAAATVNAANARAEATVRDATARAEAILTSAQQRAARLDEHTGRRVTYLTDTHAEVMRRLNEISTVLGDLLHKEQLAGPILDEASVVPPPPKISTEVVEPDLEPAADRSGEEDRYGEPDEARADEPRDDAEPPAAEEPRDDEPVREHAHDYRQEYPHEPGHEGGRDHGPGGEAVPEYGPEPHDGRFGHAGPAAEHHIPNGGYPERDDRDERPGEHAERLPENDLFRARTPARPEDR